MTAAAAEINPRFVVVADLLICPARDRFRHSASQMDAQKEIARIDDDDTWAAVAMRRYMAQNDCLHRWTRRMLRASKLGGPTDAQSSVISVGEKAISFPSILALT